MKLKEGFVLHTLGDEHMVVATGPAAHQFNGLVRNNATAQFLFEQLCAETTEAQLVDAMAAHYDAPIAKIAADVHALLQQLRVAGFLDE